MNSVFYRWWDVIATIPILVMYVLLTVMGIITWIVMLIATGIAYAWQFVKQYWDNNI